MTGSLARATVLALPLLALTCSLAHGQDRPSPPANPFDEAPRAAPTAAAPAPAAPAPAREDAARGPTVAPAAASSAEAPATEPRYVRVATVTDARPASEPAEAARALTQEEETEHERGAEPGALVALSAAATEAAPAPAPPSEAFSALDAVLSGDARDPLAGAEPATHDPEPPPDDVPSREETASAIAAITPDVRACASDQSGRVVEVQIVFASTGRVTTATVTPGSVRLTPAQRSCVARALRRARLPSFERPRFEVTYPMRF